MSQQCQAINTTGKRCGRQAQWYVPHAAVGELHVCHHHSKPTAYPQPCKEVCHAQR